MTKESEGSATCLAKVKQRQSERQGSHCEQLGHMRSYRCLNRCSRMKQGVPQRRGSHQRQPSPQVKPGIYAGWELGKLCLRPVRGRTCAESCVCLYLAWHLGHHGDAPHTPPQVQLPCAIGGLGRTASGAVHLPELDGSTAQSHCYKQCHSS